MSNTTTSNGSALIAKKNLEAKFKKQGVMAGLLSGFTFGVYGVIVGFAMEMDPLLGASALVVPIIGSALNDIFAAIWLLIYNIIKGRGKEIGRSLRTKPGKMICLAALFGGPIANAAYLIGIQNAGAAYAIPISALCPMVGAILSRILFNQKISKRVMFGMLLCIVGAGVISYVPPQGDVPNFYLGIGCAILAAVGWGVEGAISSFGGSILDPNIAINIRQGVSGLAFLIIVVPLFGGMGLMVEAIKVPMIVIIIAIAALSAAVSFLSWYKSNSMCGCATGMALNITYVFWGIVFAAIVSGQALTPITIIGACIILLGALIVSVNPLDFFKKKEA